MTLIHRSHEAKSLWAGLMPGIEAPADRQFILWGETVSR